MATDESEEMGGVEGDVGERIDDRVDGFDERIVELLSWVLDTETRARIYLYLRQHPGSTSEEIAEGTGLYPSTVREALAALAEEGTVYRGKRASGGAGNNPYEYETIAPLELVGELVEDVQAELNTVCNLDRIIGGEEPDDGPVSISVRTAENDD